MSTESLLLLPSTIQLGMKRQRNQGQEARAPNVSFSPAPCCPLLLSSDSHLSLSVQFIECFLKNVHLSGLTGVQRRSPPWMAGEGGRQVPRPRAPPLCFLTQTSVRVRRGSLKGRRRGTKQSIGTSGPSGKFCIILLEPEAHQSAKAVSQTPPPTFTSYPLVYITTLTYTTYPGIFSIAWQQDYNQQDAATSDYHLLGLFPLLLLLYPRPPSRHPTLSAF